MCLSPTFQRGKFSWVANTWAWRQCLWRDRIWPVRAGMAGSEGGVLSAARISNRLRSMNWQILASACATSGPPDLLPRRTAAKRQSAQRCDSPCSRLVRMVKPFMSTCLLARRLENRTRVACRSADGLYFSGLRKCDRASILQFRTATLPHPVPERQDRPCFGSTLCDKS